MDERTLKFRVGVVVVAGAAILIILITLLGAWPSPFKARYTVLITFPRAPGVTVDTPVRKSGIQIGRVSDVELQSDGEVLLTLRIDKHYKLHTNEVCRISTGSLVTGDAVLEFVNPTDEPLSEEWIQNDEYMTNGVVETNPFQALSDMQGEIALALNSIEGAGREVTTLARRMNTLMETKEDQLGGIVDKTELALDSFNRAMTSFESVFGDPELQGQLRDSLAGLPQLFADARDTLAITQKTLDGFARVSVRAEQNLANLEEFTAPLGERGEMISQNLASSVKNVDELLTNLVRLSRAINSQQGTIGQLIHNRELYDKFNRAAEQLEASSRKLQPIINDVRIFTDKIARDPRQLGVKGALDQRPAGSGLKLPLR
jgi:phospholipid/cholesterol/gamma-HCH transport system substrate-binding protein